jgi:hypothetical protein
LRGPRAGTRHGHRPVLCPVAHLVAHACHLIGIEYDPVTTRIARLVNPEARVQCEDYARSHLTGHFDLVIGNPPFSDRVVRADPVTCALGLRLHDYFIARSIARPRPGGIALFVTSTGTMDKADDEPAAGAAWTDLAPVPPAPTDDESDDAGDTDEPASPGHCQVNRIWLTVAAGARMAG